MKKILIFILIIIVLGAGYWLISPFFVNKKVSEVSPLVGNDSIPTEVSENVKEKNLPQITATGNFSGFDKIHYGSGTVSLIEADNGYILRFENDFNVANGPDLYVGLGKDGKYIKGSELSKLKGNIGSQNYSLPQDFNLSNTNEVWIWCKAFSVPFAKALLAQ